MQQLVWEQEPALILAFGSLSWCAETRGRNKWKLKLGERFHLHRSKLWFFDSSLRFLLFSLTFLREAVIETSQGYENAQFSGCLLAQVQQESPDKKPRLHCDVDNNLITSTTLNTNTPRKAISRVGRRGSLNGRE